MQKNEKIVVENEIGKFWEGKLHNKPNSNKYNDKTTNEK